MLLLVSPISSRNIHALHVGHHTTNMAIRWAGSSWVLSSWKCQGLHQGRILGYWRWTREAKGLKSWQDLTWLALSRHPRMERRYRVTSEEVDRAQDSMWTEAIDQHMVERAVCKST